MPTLWGHHYLGPGNPIRSGEPVDVDDAIAEIHDLQYQIGPSDVSAADATAVDRFVGDFQRTGNLHSLIGGIGLQAKRTVEGITGQLYPNPMHRGGKADYKYATKRLSEIYRQHKKDNPSSASSWREFQKLHFGALMREGRSKRGHGADEDGSGKRSRDDDGAAAGPSGLQEQRGGNQPETVPDDDWDMALRLLDDPTGGSAGAPDVESMETLANPSKGGGVSGHSGRAGGQMPVGLPRTPKTPYYTKTYRKNWIFFSYAFTHKRHEINKNYLYTTPLQLIPVDLLAFYLDPTEFSLLFGRSVAVECKCRVTPWGCRMNFQTGQSESKWATSEFVAIGQATVGINNAMPGENRVYVANSQNPMTVDTLNTIDTNALHEKLYGDDNGRGAAQMVPRHLNLYWTPKVALRSANNENRFTHQNGPPKFDQYIDRFLVNTTIGTPVVNYTYRPKKGIIADTYSCDYINGDNLFRAASRAQQLGLKAFSSAGGQLVEGVVTQEGRADPNEINNWHSSFVANLYQTIEHYDTYDWDRGHIHGNTQPQVHVGLTAVPAINPGTEGVDFQNASIYWCVESEITVHHYQNSCFHEGTMHTYNPSFYPNGYVKKYHTGQTYNHHPNLNEAHFYLDTREGANDTIKASVGIVERLNELETQAMNDVEMLPPAPRHSDSLSDSGSERGRLQYIAHKPMVRKSAQFSIP